MDRKNFIRQEEDFVCENCGAQVKGSGYTNHCPDCLYSKHVDIVPGDRANVCGGLMEPVAMTLIGGLPDKIIHRCLKCGEKHRNKIAEMDDPNVLATLDYE